MDDNSLRHNPSKTDTLVPSPAPDGLMVTLPEYPLPLSSAMIQLCVWSTSWVPWTFSPASSMASS